MDTQALWQVILAELQLQVSKGVFQTFLSQSTLVSLTDTTAVIGCTQPMHIMYLEKRYSKTIKQTLDAYTKKDISLVFTVRPTNGKKYTDGPLFRNPSPQRTTPELFPTSTQLNQDYTFENFAVSSSNQMAYAAATAVAQTPGLSYNPLFLYGGVGVGKTHLMQAIGHTVLQKKPKTKIMYCTSEEFTNEIIEAIQTKTATAFKKRYRHVDMLLIDDVQFIAGKNTAQEEFFHTFNAIHQSKGQIILTSDRSPEEIPKLEARLRSRFEGGLIIDIGNPDFELRTAILLIKAKHRGVTLSMEIAKIIASVVENPRKLEGMLIRILTESETKHIPITPEFVSVILGKPKDSASKQPVNIDQVAQITASYYNIKVSQLKGAKRDAALALPRQVLYYILRVELNLPLMTIGETLGGRDHTTILHGVRKVTNLLSTNEKIKTDILGIKQRLLG